MGFLEAAAVVYLRTLYYPEGFSFPLKNIPIDIFLVETGREISTIVMLIFIGIISGKTLLEQFCYFLYSFGIWDIFYYVWLKVILNWPPSPLTWDLLFLVPVPWLAPVLAPFIVALTMIIVASRIIYLREKGIYFKISKLDLALGALTALLIFISFVMDFPRIVNQELPSKYHWEMLVLGEFLSLFVAFRIIFLKQRIEGCFSRHNE